MRPVQLVVNPAAGGGRASRLLPRVQAALQREGAEVRTCRTRSLEHAEQLAHQGAAEGRLVASLGGDGLAGRVAGAVADSGGLLLVLPGGRGNDFCRGTGTGQDPVAAAALVRTGVERTVDLGVVTSAQGTVPFLGIASTGYDAEVQERTLRLTLPLGSLVYAYGALAALASWRPARFTGARDGVPYDVTGWNVAVANNGTYGGGMRLAPAARLDDGLLDMVTTAATSRLVFLSALPRLFRGTHTAMACVQVATAREVVIDADRPFRVFADGDPAGTLPCTVAVRPGALRILLPR